MIWRSILVSLVCLFVCLFVFSSCLLLTHHHNQQSTTTTDLSKRKSGGPKGEKEKEKKEEEEEDPNKSEDDHPFRIGACFFFKYVSVCSEEKEMDGPRGLVRDTKNEWALCFVCRPPHAHHPPRLH